jgi:four helix bundle protein
MQNYRNLRVWEKNHELVLAVYRATTDFPKTESYGLTSQIRRASASIPANIAEGCGRSGYPEFSRFIFIAMGSDSELDHLLLLAKDLQYLAKIDYIKMSDDLTHVRRMLHTLSQSVKPQSKAKS